LNLLRCFEKGGTQTTTATKNKSDDDDGDDREEEEEAGRCYCSRTWETQRVLLMPVDDGRYISGCKKHHAADLIATLARTGSLLAA
jgi:hypothetical protein